MAESKTKIEFETRKRIFDLVGDQGVCTFCQIIPRKGPIYMSKMGAIVCSTCKDSKTGKFQQNEVTKLLEKLFSTLPKPCKFKKNDCKIIMDIQSIEYHEEDCNHRDIQCILKCAKMLPASSIFDHLETAHGISFEEPDFNYEKKGSRFIFNKSLDKIEKSDVENERARHRQDTFWTNWLVIPNKVIFAVHFLFDTEIRMAKGFVKILGSKFEAMNYKYAIKVEDPVFGDHYFQNQVKSLDDKKMEVFESNACLILSLEMFREYIGKNFKFVVEIEDLKPREEENRESMKSDDEETM